jgi:hypothetical protein
MVNREAYKIAQAIRTLKPDPASATVGERLLWGRTVHALTVLLSTLVTRDWDGAEFERRIGYRD